ncbi:hypothetical protein BZA05DRAFT_167452 [Tricharina praecox]|uniref:uncharacterized protein n=1 Tax=Tricharina praecox TaxID=43433 RepID=UPI00221FD0E8|nr:uncharacterized protein BZA05DRAFT_167452 [Tricharina praecox]KAI5857159.1 hypothetical protein BZA05DRAFT_167452 [Tricharina praecox]
MEQAYPIPPSPRRLSERRGKPELQPLGPILPSPNASTPTFNSGPTATRDADIESLNSSIPSGVFSPDNYGTPVMSAPATPTDISPIRHLAMPFGAGSSIVGTSIQEEDEASECDCQECEDRCGEYGLGLAVGAAGTMGTKDVAFPRLDTVRTVREAFEESCYGSHYHYNEKLAPIAMPPTPPSNASEQPFMFSNHGSPTSPAIDAEAFSSGPSSLTLPPRSPKNEGSLGGGARLRATSILNKVVPAKLRASLKRRISGTNDMSAQPPPLQPIDTMPTYSAVIAPGTPPDDSFGRWHVEQQTSLPRAEDNYSPLSSPEAILPPTLLPSSISPRSPCVETDSFFASPLQSPRTVGMPAFARMESLPETPTDVVCSPLHPPTISPLMSPSLASTSQTSLGTWGGLLHAHKKVPSIDPATSSAPRKPAAPLTLVTANSLADMIEEMQSEIDAYDATLARMVSSGWSSPQEIRNVELQREEHRSTWQTRVNESKKMLEGMRRTEVKYSAMSSVSSFDSFGSTQQATSSQLTSVTSLPNIDAYSHSGSERSSQI